MSALHQYYVKDCDHSLEAFCDYDKEHLSSRVEETKRITSLMDENHSFSFIRLGDMDLTLLLAQQDGLVIESEKSVKSVDGTMPMGSPGIGVEEHGERLWRAFENASYLDYYEAFSINRQLLPKLNLTRATGSTRNPSPETSFILTMWVQREFKGFCERDDEIIGMAGAEAAMLEALSKHAEFESHAAEIWPSKNLLFHQVRNDGRDLGRNLDLIKSDLIDFIQTNKITTLFLSLGGGAKILAHELSHELNVRIIDFGAMMRTLCDLGSDGQSSVRSTHSIMLYRLPFKMVCDALEKVFSNIPKEQLLAKIHAQLIHLLAPDNSAASRASRELDVSPDNVRAFKSAYQTYKKNYSYLFRHNQSCRLERKRFFLFCGKHGLNLHGRFAHLAFTMKTMLKNAISARS